MRIICCIYSLGASSPIWASETSLARTRERAAKPRVAEDRPLARAFSRGTLRLPKQQSLLAGYCIYKYFVRQLKACFPSFCHSCACEMSPEWGHLITWMDPSVGHLNGILAWIGENLNNNFQKSEMPGGMLKLRFDRYICNVLPGKGGGEREQRLSKVRYLASSSS